jgi:hypothetical protein
MFTEIDPLHKSSDMAPQTITYEAPQLVEYGRVEVLTQGMSFGGIPGDCDPNDPGSCF